MQAGRGEQHHQLVAVQLAVRHLDQIEHEPGFRRGEDRRPAGLGEGDLRLEQRGAQRLLEALVTARQDDGDALRRGPSVERLAYAEGRFTRLGLGACALGEPNVVRLVRLSPLELEGVGFLGEPALEPVGQACDRRLTGDRGQLQAEVLPALAELRLQVGGEAQEVRVEAQSGGELQVERLLLDEALNRVARGELSRIIELEPRKRLIERAHQRAEPASARGLGALEVLRAGAGATQLPQRLVGEPDQAACRRSAALIERVAEHVAAYDEIKQRGGGLETARGLTGAHLVDPASPGGDVGLWAALEMSFRRHHGEPTAHGACSSSGW